MYKKVGIPRGLFYYKYFPLWKTFLEELGAEITVSDATNKRILDAGVKACVDEACLPVKLFHGHVLNLVGRVDCLFIPRFTSISKNEYVCPQFGGLPDTVRHTLKQLPPVIDTEVNLRKSSANSWKAALETGRWFTSDKRLIKAAFEKAVREYRHCRNKVRQGELPLPPAASGRSPAVENIAGESDGGEALKIAVIGHAYNLYDTHINMNLLQKLVNNGVRVITTDMVPEELINLSTHLLHKPMFWNFGRKALGSAFHLADAGKIDGIIYVMSFGCGIDSFVSDLMERRLKRQADLPFILLTLDEHSGEAGLDTRLEAFIDMIQWRKDNENNISASG